MSVSDRIIGCVNWFDSKKGYGFINVLTPDNENTGKDIFVHYTSINVVSNYKKLYPGEYTEFCIENRDNRLCCVDVTGIYRCSLLIDNETHRYKVYPKNSQVNSEESVAGESVAEKSS